MILTQLRALTERVKHLNVAILLQRHTPEETALPAPAKRNFLLG
jgi:hypothetical protein